MDFPGVNYKNMEFPGVMKKIMWNFQGRLGNRKLKFFKKNSTIPHKKQMVFKLSKTKILLLLVINLENLIFTWFEMVKGGLLCRMT